MILKKNQSASTYGVPYGESLKSSNGMIVYFPEGVKI